MNWMRKIGSFGLAALLTLSMAACQNSESTSSASSAGSQASSGNTGSSQTESQTESEASSGSESVEAETALDFLNAVWDSFAEEEKFPAAGGDSSEENMTMNAPGKFSIEDAAILDSTLGFPADAADQIDDAASLTHMMNANNFTCGVFHVAGEGSAEDVAEALKENILKRQWMCGFPEELVIVTVGDYVVSTFGTKDILDTFQEKLQEVYPSAEVFCEEAIA